jgi:hypothetical protein
MVQVTARGGPTAARGGAAGVAGADQVGQLAAEVIAGLGAGVVAGAAGNRDHADVQAGRIGAGGRVAAGEAAVRGGGPVGG